MGKIIIKDKSEGVAGASLKNEVIEDLSIVCDTSNGKKEILVYINGEVIFGRDFSRKAKMIHNHVAVYED